jgi:UDP-N-acetylglucosamine diphosphorylase / glucose-1-phosphate thymidylyltransferase / UDP-N-acetylgalactosamine diphosphorylase / glucosamine-1-phosphate N-acetyltransferase / galactosamine-1-phosphate N-acetyltransferase
VNVGDAGANGAPAPMSTVQRAVVLAAGRGRRMRELTESIPKPMVKVRGKPVLQFIVEGLCHSGIKDLLIIVGYRKEVVRNHFQDGSSFGIQIRYAEQIVQDGTGRVVSLAQPFCGDEPFLLSYGDILVDAVYYPRLCDLKDAEMSIAVRRSNEVSKGGAVYLNDRFELTDLREKPKPGEAKTPWYNAGIYVFRASIFDYVAQLEKSPRGEYELTDAIRAMSLSGKHVQAVEIAGDWADVRDPEVLAELNENLESGS